MNPGTHSDRHVWTYVLYMIGNMHQRLERLAKIARKCESFILVTGPNSEIYEFTTCWGKFFETFRGWCKDLQVDRYDDATLVAEHIERADQYHGRKTVANVLKAHFFLYFTASFHNATEEVSKI